jgi:hypothetical protein
LNDESLELIGQRRGVLNFEYEGEGYRTIDPARPSAAVAHPETFIRKHYRASGLSVAEPIRFGSWCGRSKFLSFQDVIVAAKRS